MNILDDEVQNGRNLEDPRYRIETPLATFSQLYKMDKIHHKCKQIFIDILVD